MHILIVEDEERLAKALKKGLEIKGYAVDWLADSEKARSRILLYRNEYDLILLDLMLPGIDGATITESVRKEGVVTPIIVLTARNETEHKIDLLNKGADDYVVKPFSFEELLSRINAVLRRPAQSKPVVFKVGPLEMDMATRTVRKDGEKLFDHVWDFNSLSWSNVLDVHMKNLRKKLGTDANGDQLFETVRGVGYRLAGEVRV